ncbi:MAG: dihydroorotate dehydrogenase, partial [Eggerthellaceae bacterium]|nr:dihydroorotate dehydrogenase [Eggerthellaceae bacterium]
MAAAMRMNLAGVEMKNPVTVASGTFGQGREYSQFFNLEQLGAITTKGVTAVPWEGNPGVRIAETPSGMLNSIGLQNKGVQNMIENELPWLQTQGTIVIVNIAGHSVHEYCNAIQTLEDSSAKFEAYEVNISCPNVDKGGMAFGQDPKMAAEVISHAKETATRPVIAKLSPNVTDITQIALAVQKAGADAVSMINTILGMAINAEEQR